MPPELNFEALVGHVQILWCTLQFLLSGTVASATKYMGMLAFSVVETKAL